MSSINVSFNSEDNTVKIFDEFYGTEAVISAEQFDLRVFITC